MKRLRSPLALIKARVHPVVWLFIAKLALLGFVLVLSFNLQFPALMHRAVLAWIQSGFTDGTETSYEKVDTHWLGALGFKLDGRSVAEC